MLEQLIIEGQQLQKPGDNEQFARSKFLIWLNASIQFLEVYYTNSILTKKFIREYQEGTQQNIYYYNSMLSILEGLKKMEDYESMERQQAIDNSSNW